MCGFAGKAGRVAPARTKGKKSSKAASKGKASKKPPVRSKKKVDV